MKIIAYKVFPRNAVALSDVLKSMHEIKLEERVRTIGATKMRLDEASPLPNGGWYLDFAKIRPVGPGRASDAAPVQDFDLEPGEGFGEETAAYFNNSSGHLILQYNHYGPRSAMIQAYIYRFTRLFQGQPEHDELPDAADGFNLAPVLKPEQSSRLQQMGIMKKFKFSIHVPSVLSRPETGTGRKALGWILNHPVTSSAETVKIEIMAGREKKSTLSVEVLKNMVKDLLGIKDELEDLEVFAKETEDSPSEHIDLFDSRLTADIPVLYGAHSRLPRQDRWTALSMCHTTWSANNQLL